MVEQSLLTSAALGNHLGNYKNIDVQGPPNSDSDLVGLKFSLGMRVLKTRLILMCS